jgi:cation diffusion facilitator family transporter
VKQLPLEGDADLRRAKRLEWLTIAWMLTVIAAVGFTMGSSQAMRTAWIEDLLSLIPALVFLIAAKLEPRPETPRFPYGFHRVNSLAFLIAAVALVSVGISLLIESVTTLIAQEHVTIEPITLFGQTFWSGWLMIAALAYSIVPPVVLGRLKLPVAKRINDKVLHTDAMMQKADWQTGLAGIAGVVGIGLGYWWADALAAGLISLSILIDGSKAMVDATAELIDGTPRALDSMEVSHEAEALHDALADRYPGSKVRIRESGRFMHAEVQGAGLGEPNVDLGAIWPGEPARTWRFAQLSFVPEENSA